MKIACFLPRFLSKGDRFAFIALCVVSTVFLLHRCLFMTAYNPPNYDEAFYASPALSWYRNGTLAIPFDFPRSPDGTIIWHTAGYSLFQGAIFAVFGPSHLALRIPALVYGMSVFAVFLIAVRKRTHAWIAPLAFALFFVTDKTIVPALFNGRPDPCSFFFLMLSLLLFSTTQKMTQPFRAFVVAAVAGIILGFSCAVALRTAIACTPFILLPFLYRPRPSRPDVLKEETHRTVLLVVIFGLFAALSLLATICLAMHGFHSLLLSGQDMAGSSSFSHHFGFSFFKNVFRYTPNIPKALLFYGIVFFGLRRNWPEVRSDFFLLANCLVFLGFFLFIKGWGPSAPYSMLFLPTVYLVFSIALDRALQMKKRAIPAFLLLVFLINVVTILPKNVYIILNPDVQREQEIAKRIHSIVPSGAMVVADPDFFFALESNGNPVICVPRTESVRARDMKTILAKRSPTFLICTRNELPTLENLATFFPYLKTKPPLVAGARGFVGNMVVPHGAFIEL